MLIRPRDLAERIAGVHPAETIRLPIDAERCEAREIINQSSQSTYLSIVENRRQLPNGYRSSSQSGAYQPRTEQRSA